MIWLEIAIVVLLVIVNGVFAMSELAVVSSSKTRLKVLAKQGSRGAIAAIALAKDPSRFLSTVQVGITLIGILTGAFGGATLSEDLAAYLDTFAAISPYGKPIAIVIVVLGITYLSLIVGELVPKQLALRNPERIAAVVARPMHTLSKLGRPLVYLLEVSSGRVLRLLGSNPDSQQTVTEEEVKEVIAEGARTGVLKKFEQEMISGVMRLADWRVELIMTDREDLVWIDLDQDPAQIWQQVRDTTHSRIIATRGGLANVRGLLQAKDMLDCFIDGRAPQLETLLCHPQIAHRDLPATDALEILRLSPIHMLFVMDEAGTFEGIVTITDVVKAIVGGLAEHGLEEPKIVQRQDGSWLADGDVLLEVLADTVSLGSLPTPREFDSAAGLILWSLERVPAEGDYIHYAGFRFEVVDMDGQRIDKILVQRPPDDSGGDEGLGGG